MGNWKILVVEDSATSRLLMTNIMEPYGQVDEAVDGEIAVKYYEQALAEDKPYHLILLDMGLPNMNGLEFLQWVRNMEEENGMEIEERVRIIMVTAHKKYFAAAFLRGCDDYVVKPVDTTRFLNKVDVYLKESI